MNLYPAIISRMGDWKYFIVRMTMRDVAQEVRFASELLNDPSLDNAIQRTLSESRAKKEIATYLRKREDRFFSSLVVAALEGSPKFVEVSVEDVQGQEIFSGGDFDQVFGILRFSSDRTYYALDGQHRLMAIKHLIEEIDNGNAASRGIPEDFDKEQLSVLMVCGERKDRDFIPQYRRLFSSLNRYAKATDNDTNIIMDEDDMFAILTRRLINDHPFFKSEDGNFRVQTKGKNIVRRRNEPNNRFTTLQTLYAMNETFLKTADRGHNLRWYSGRELKLFKSMRPSDEALEVYYAELQSKWNSLIEALPVLTKNPADMRVFEEPDLQHANMLFMPIGQEVLAQVVTDLIDGSKENDKLPKILAPLNSLQWHLAEPPWRHLFLVKEKEEDKWKMRTGEREPARHIALRILNWQLGIGKEKEQDLYVSWKGRLVPSQEEAQARAMWQQVKKFKIE